MRNPRKYRMRRTLCLRFAMAMMLLVLQHQVSGAAGNRCRAEQYTVLKGNKFGTCRDCPRCEEGYEPSPPCEDFINSNTVVKCKTCILGSTYSQDYGTEGCKPCAICHPDQVVKRECTLTSNRVCDLKCKSKDTYYQKEVTYDCQKCSRCCGVPSDQRQQECIDKGMPLNQQCSVNTAGRCKEPSTLAYTGHDKSLPASQKNSKATHTTQTFLSTMLSHTTTNSFKADGNSKTQQSILAVVLPVISALILMAGIIYYCVRHGHQTSRLNHITNCFGAQNSTADHDSTGKNEEVSIGLERQSTDDSSTSLQQINTDKRCLTELRLVNEYHQICLLLQCKPKEIKPECGDYKDIAKHYSIRFEEICSLENADALFVLLETRQPYLTVEEFAAALTTRKINRTDVVKILYNYYYCN